MKLAPARSSWVRKTGYDYATGTLLVSIGRHAYGYRAPERSYQVIAKTYSASGTPAISARSARCASPSRSSAWRRADDRASGTFGAEEGPPTAVPAHFGGAAEILVRRLTSILGLRSFQDRWS